MTGRIAGSPHRSRFVGQASGAQSTLGQTGELYLRRRRGAVHERCGRTLQIAVAGVTSKQIAGSGRLALPRSIGARNVKHHLE
jgi:hypothetical protein